MQQQQQQQQHQNWLEMHEQVETQKTTEQDRLLEKTHPPIRCSQRANYVTIVIIKSFTIEWRINRCDLCVLAAGFLTRDSRIVERKKPGMAKARRSYQWYHIYHHPSGLGKALRGRKKKNKGLDAG
ncbi:hypothetical protein M8C21_029713 [Ambrosia artemisiifolia]|uniref:Uncharacterized protein n=1 Tax=Ambrosia artemisiifolia TaxID=4212 RepID=A0AAD5G1S3_AMBAR|nr:hypothetical protein M8C21_029713 [Ambrosia artemisiifolia]